MLTWAVGCTPAAGMGNVLSAEKRQQVIALGRLGWSLRRIEEATGVRRETASTYLRAAGVVVRPPGRWGQPPKPAIEVSTDSGAGPASNPANGVGVSTDSPAAPPLPRPGRSPAARAGAVGPERRRGVPGVRVRALRQPFPRLSFLQAAPALTAQAPR